MYKLLVDPAGFINIVTASVDSQEPQIIINRIENPFCVLKYLSVFRTEDKYQPFYVKKATDELIESGIYFLLYWVMIEDGALIEWRISETGKYSSQQPVLEENTIKELWSNLVWTNFPGYAKITQKLPQNILSQLEKQKKTFDDIAYFDLKIKVLRQKGDLETAISSCEEAIRFNPNEWSFYKNYFQLCVEQNNTDYALEQCIKLINNQIDLNYTIYQNLLNLIEIYGQAYHFDELRKNIPQDDNGDIFAEIWHKLNQVNIESQDFSEYKNNFELEKTKLYFLKNTDYKYINLDVSLTEAEQLVLQNFGLSETYIKFNKQTLLEKNNGEQKQQEKIFDDNLPPQVSNLIQTNEFQKSLITEGKIAAVCPFTGKILYSECCISYRDNKGYAFNYYLRFKSIQTFYLIIGATFGMKLALYFPNTEIAICFSHQGLGKDIESLLKLSINDWKSYLVFNWEKTYNFLLKKSENFPKILILHQWHLGHHLWNILSGIYQLYEWDCLAYIDKFFVVAEPLAKLEDMFPEIPASKIERVKVKNDQIANEVLENNYLPIPYGQNFVKEKLVNRIYQASAKNCPPEVIKEIEQARNEHFPLLWINIRAGSRSWLSQIEGTANIINKLAEDFPNLGIVFDGISLIQGQNKNSSSPAIETEKKIISEIKALIKKPVKTYNLIGGPIAENLTWVKNIDLYLCHWGNGQTKPALIANKPGVVHCNKQVLKIPLSHRWVSWERENCVLPTYISEEHIQESQVINLDPRNTLDNYDIDWQVIYQELLKVIQQCERYQNFCRTNKEDV